MKAFRTAELDPNVNVTLLSAFAPFNPPLANPHEPLGALDGAKFIVDVPAVRVNPVIVDASNILLVLFDVSVNVPLPSFTVRVPAPLIDITAMVTLGLLMLKSSVPVNAPIVI